MADEFFPTTIDATTGRVDVPMVFSLHWFDNFRQGVVGLITLIPSDVGDGTWQLTVADSPAIDAAMERAAEGMDE